MQAAPAKAFKNCLDSWNASWCCRAAKVPRVVRVRNRESSVNLGLPRNGI